MTVPGDGARHSTHDFTVAWIAPLALEATAARAMLDVELDEPEDFEQSDADSNVYTWGIMSKHKVVIASLPAGRIGLVSAAVTAQQILASLPSIRMGLLVGIGGGIPSSGRDIRLGDVVVAQPKGTSGGVDQYDLGKTKAEGKFERTGSLNSPPQVLLNAVTKVKGNHRLGKNNLEKFLQEMIKRHPSLAEPYDEEPAYVHPGIERDRLFDPGNVHPDGAESCDGCGEKQETKRDPRLSLAPKIWYGLIASGNQVIKDAVARDKIGTDYLCVEMEAAGLMNNFPCLAVRGICDYSDTHKNDLWQGYAAATAAAYSKELLAVIRVPDIRKQRLAKDILSSVHENVKNIHSILEDSTTDRILDWISPLEPIQRHQAIRGARIDGTGDWFLRTDEFSKWRLGTRSNALFCFGGPGVGKTIMTSLIIDYLMKERINDANVGIAFLYCDYRDGTNQTIQNLIGAVLKQFLRQSQAIPDTIRRAHEMHKEQRLDTTELIEHLLLACGMFSRVYLCIDALDECGDPQGLLRSIRSVEPLHFVGTGRKSVHNNVHEILKNPTTLCMEAKEEDISRFVRTRVENPPTNFSWLRDKSFKNEVISGVLKKSANVFLLAKLQVDAILAATRQSKCRKILALLPETVEKAYTNTFQRIEKQEKAHLDDAQKILTLVHLAEQPLSVDELLCALATEEGDMDIDPENFPCQTTFLDCCLGLVTIDFQSSTVRLVHYTLEEHLKSLDSLFGRSRPQAQEYLARLCLTYLIFPSVSAIDTERVWHEWDRHKWDAGMDLLHIFENAMWDDLVWSQDDLGSDTESSACLKRHREEIISRVRCLALFRYAVCGWAYHASRSPTWENSTKTALERYVSNYSPDTMLMTEGVISQYLSTKLWSLMHDVNYPLGSWWPYSDPTLCKFDRRTSIMNLVSFFGMHQFFDQVIYSGSVLCLEPKEGLRMPWQEINIPADPLSLACICGHATLVQRMIELGKDPNWRPAQNSNAPLHWAARLCREDVFTVLLEKGADPFIKGRYGMTALACAVMAGMESGVHRILHQSTDTNLLNLRDDFGRSLLHHAHHLNRSESILRLLLEKGANPNISDEYGNTPLLYFIEGNHRGFDVDEGGIKLLLRYGAYPGVQNVRGETILSLASKLDCSKKLVEFIQEHQAKHNIADSQKRKAEEQGGSTAAEKRMYLN